jgi:hypothetical protein
MAFKDLITEMKCKDFRIEVEEGLKGDSLSIAAQDHAGGCRPCREFNQKHVEFREWLTVCQKITAPKNFQFGVQRKIGDAKSVHAHGWAWERLRYIVPATALTAVLVMVGLYAINSGTFSNSGPGVAVLDTNVNRTSTEEARVPEKNTSAPVEPVKEEIASSTNTNKQENPRVESPKGGTLDSQSTRRNIDQAAPGVDKPKTPAGINPNGSSPSADRSKTLLAMQGFGAVTGVVDMKVKAVKGDSPAGRSGIKVGDIVESVNGTAVTVKRGGQTLQITVQ